MTKSINLIRASDGSGNASVATITSIRAALASTILVDTVAGIPAKFHGSMGTPHRFVDPVTSEEITVISEATAVDFEGYVDGANLEITVIAPGYTDTGSEAQDIVIIRPTTPWADNIADVLDTSHDEDGSLKDDIVTTPKMLNDAVTDAKRTRFKGCVVSSGIQQTSSSTPAPIEFTVEEHDPDGWHDNVTNNSRITVSEAGMYAIHVHCVVVGITSTDVGKLYFYKNGAGIEISTGGGDTMSQEIDADMDRFRPNFGIPFIELAADDYIEVYGEHDNADVLFRDRRFSVVKLSD